MATKDTVRRIIVDANTADAAAAKVGKAEASVKGLDGALGGLAKQALVAGAAYFSTTGLINAMSRSIDLAREQERVERKLQHAVGGSISYWKQYASEIQRTSNFGDEQILNQLALARSLGLSSRRMRETIQAAVELSAATDMSLDSAVRNLAKSYSGLAGELGELIPALRGMTSEQLQNGAAVQYVLQNMAGTAQATADSIEQQKNAWGDLLELVGGPVGTWWEGVGQNFLNMAQDVATAYNWLSGERGITGIEKLTIEAVQRIKEKQEELAESQRTAFQGPMIDPAELSRRLKESATGAIPEQEFVMESLEQELEQRYSIIEAREEEQRLRDEAHQAVMLNFEDEIAKMREEQRIFEDNLSRRMALERRARAEVISITAGSLADLNAALEGSSMLTLRLMQIEGTSRAILSGVNTTEQLSRYLPPPLPQIAGAAVAAGQLAQVAKMKKARYGADFVTSGPQLLLVGDNPGGEEEVRVRPKGSPNINGPQGEGGFVFNNYGVMDQRAMRRYLMPMVMEELQRRAS